MPIIWSLHANTLMCIELLLFPVIWAIKFVSCTAVQCYCPTTELELYQVWSRVSHHCTVAKVFTYFRSSLTCKPWINNLLKCQKKELILARFFFFVYLRFKKWFLDRLNFRPIKFLGKEYKTGFYTAYK